MKRRFVKKSVAILVVLVLGISMLMSACGSAGDTTQDQTAATPADAGVSGSVVAAGSTALQPLAQRASELFMQTNTDAQIQIQGGGSGNGLTQVAQGAVDIGNSDVFAEEKLEDANQVSSLVDHKVCVVGFAAVVNSEVTVTDLTSDQLIGIFTGKITNWKDVGGPDLKIVILNRPASSGTRATFKKYALNGQDEASGLAMTEESSGVIKQMLNDNKGSISYLALSYVDSSVKALSYNGVAPTAENVENGTYPIWSYEHMYTKGEPTGAVKAFIDYMMSDDFKPNIVELGYIPNSDMKVSR